MVGQPFDRVERLYQVCVGCTVIQNADANRAMRADRCRRRDRFAALLERDHQFIVEAIELVFVEIRDADSESTRY